VDTINLRIDFEGEVTLNGECTVRAPIEMVWFADNDLVIETPYEKIVFCSSEPFSVITPKVADKELTAVRGVELKLVENNVARYVIVNDKYACQLPRSIFEMV